MRPVIRFLTRIAAVWGIAFAATSFATDVDGPNDCDRAITDWGDAPENVLAYPSVTGHFPTCLLPIGSNGGNQTSACPPISSPPGFCGLVKHTHLQQVPGYWLGWPPAGSPPMGIDSEADGKTNDTGLPNSACSGIPVDCTESAFGMSFGQDECYGSDDAGLVSFLVFGTCSSGTLTFRTYSCWPADREVHLNILVDWNADGDWNDNFLCPVGCAYEWAVKNATIMLPPGAGTITSPAFLTGPNIGPGWMRITISDEMAPDNFPWLGSMGIGQDGFSNGETEDYPVSIGCKQHYTDYGDAPEEFQAYPATSVVGRFPTCLYTTPPGTKNNDCALATSPWPGPTGFVRHVAALTDTVQFWLGCGGWAQGVLFSGVDSEPDGKSSLIPPNTTQSMCDPSVTIDCTEPIPGWDFGQDECLNPADLDHGLHEPTNWKTCRLGQVTFDAFNCSDHDVRVYVNVLVDWNMDGDWNDWVACDPVIMSGCAFEWCVSSWPLVLAPGCGTYTTPSFLVGRYAGLAWMRLTLTGMKAPSDFSWAGSANLLGQEFIGGETEDYLVRIHPLDPTESGGTPQIDNVWLEPVVPNPAANLTTVQFALPRAADVTIQVYDVAGRRLVELLHERMPAGRHAVDWDFRDAAGADVPAGLYFVRLHAGDRVLTQRVVHVQ